MQKLNLVPQSQLSMPDLAARILQAINRPSYSPIKPKILFKRMYLNQEDYPDFRRALREMIHQGKIELGRNNTLKAVSASQTILGVYKRTASGLGFVRPNSKPGDPGLPDVRIREGREQDASSGDTVLVKLTRKATAHRDAAGDIIRIVERATRNFVGTYFERDGEAFVRIDGTVFSHSVLVDDPGAKGVKPNDKVVVEMLKFPTNEERGEGVIVEVLGPLHQPGVDTLTIIRTFNLPETFPEAALAEARSVAEAFSETNLHGRHDCTQDVVITIDPRHACDFDDAVSVNRDAKTGHWILTVHIADVAHFVKLGGPLDIEARKRATSVYLPQKVIPMFPELISNGLASLQQGKVRFVKTVRMEFTPHLQKCHVDFSNSAIKVTQRFHYEQVQHLLHTIDPKNTSPAPSKVEPFHIHQEAEVLPMLVRMRELAMLLRQRRIKRGSLELSMPEAVLEYDGSGRVSGAHFAVNDLSHQIIEEFMLAANEAVAEHFSKLGVPFLRRVHPAPNPEKLQEFATFAELLGYPMERHQDRFELQRLLVKTAEKPERAAVHYALLRSLKQATYSPIQDEHYALASQDYCHFTSPIRRYPDLQVHRLLDRWIKTHHASADESELIILGDHCSKMERRAETAERELVKLKILQYLSSRLGEKFEGVITGVAEYGFFAQAVQFPAEGLIHISSLTDDYYQFDSDSRSLYGRRTQQRYRLGDRVTVEVARVDLQKRMLDLRLTTHKPAPREETSAKSKSKLKRKPRKSQKPTKLARKKKGKKKR